MIGCKQFLAWLVTTFILFGINSYVFPEASFLAEPYAETGTVYFREAYGLGFFDYVTSLDFGYYVIGPRILFATIHSFWGSEAFPIVQQTVGLFLVSALATMLVLDIFKPLLSSTVLRALIGICLGLGHGYGMLAYHNFAYFGVFPCLYFLVLDREQTKNNVWIGLALLSALMVLSKGFAIAFVPVLFVAGLFEAIRCRWKNMLFYLLALSLSLPQVINVWVARNQIGSGEKASLLEVVWNAVVYYVYIIPHYMLYWMRGGTENKFYWLMHSGVIFGLTFAGCVYLVKHTSSKVVSAFLWSQLFAVVSLCLVASALRMNDMSIVRDINLAIDSYLFFSSACIRFGYLIVLLGILSTLKLRPNIEVTAGVFVFLIIGNGHYVTNKLEGVKNDFKLNPTLQASDWQSFKHYGSDPQGSCIPIHPPGWIIGLGNCRALTLDKLISAPKNQTFHIAINDRLKGLCTQSEQIQPDRVDVLSSGIDKEASLVTVQLDGVKGRSRCFEWHVADSNIWGDVELKFYKGGEQITDIPKDKIFVFLSHSEEPNKSKTDGEPTSQSRETP